ncbi:MAG TPA: DUF2752 domain-containing protein [Micromonosporaceae bacterium]
MTFATDVPGDSAFIAEAGRAGEPRYGYPAPAYVPGGRPAGWLSRLSARAPRWSGPVAIAACFASAAAYVWITNPTDSGASDPPGCLVKLTTGLDCPGCGGTRAFYYLLHGNLPQAVRNHAMAVFAAPFLVWAYIAWSVKKMTGKQLPMPKLSGRSLGAFVGAWAVFMVVRNIPVAPFTSLYV